MPRGTIKKRPDRPAPWLARYRGPDGHEHSKAFKTKQAAQDWLTAQLATINGGDWVSPKATATKFSEVAERWERTRTRLRASTQARDESVYRTHIEPRFGGRPVGSIRPSDLDGWISDLEDSGLSPATIRKAWQIVSQILRMAVRDRIIATSPARDIDLPKIDSDEPRFLSAAEVHRLFEAMPDEYAPMIYLAAFGGLRFGEVAGLQTADVDPLRKRVTIRRTVSQVRGQLEVGPPKTDKSRRTVRLPDFVVEVLVEHLHDRATGYLFTDSAGGPLMRTNFARRVFAPAVKTAEVDPLTFHGLRHSHVALLIEQGEHPRAIADRLGHTSVRTVLDVYGHLFEGADEELAGRLDEVGRKALADHTRTKSESGKVVELHGN